MTTAPNAPTTQQATRIRVVFFTIAILCLGAVGYFNLTGNAPPLPQRGESTELETAEWVSGIVAHAQDGDWIAIRGYHSADHLIASTTLKPFSHAAILDITNEEVIEAVAPIVRVVPLQSFIEATHRFEVLRPNGATIERGKSAVTKARQKIGTSYDFLGTIGLPSQKRAYCSELCAWAWDIEVDRKGPQKVLHPADMSRHGTTIFAAGPRKLGQSH